MGTGGDMQTQYTFEKRPGRDSSGGGLTQILKLGKRLEVSSKRELQRWTVDCTICGQESLKTARVTSPNGYHEPPQLSVEIV